ncbi:MAG: ParB N-terminal domain-containing protein [Georgfuchsia sp.]
MQSKIKSVKLSDIAIDGETQQRERINNDIVSEYAESMRCGAKFPVVTLFFDGVGYWLADGFHRYHATKEAGGITEINAEIREGTKRDARLFSASANGTHGIRLTNSDKRRSVMVLLGDKEWSEWPDAKIATHCHVTRKYVHQLRSEKSVTKLQNAQQTRMDTASVNPQVEQKQEEKPKEQSEDEKPEGAPDDYPDFSTEHGREKALNESLASQAEEIQTLRDRLTAYGEISDDAISAEQLIVDLRKELTTARATIEAITQSRDRYMNDNAQLKRQVAMLQKQIKKAA